MKKNVVTFVLMFFCVICLTSVYGTGPTNPVGGTIPGSLTTIVPKIWGTISYIVQVLSIGCVVFAGVRYMFAGAERKADVKKGLIYLAVGAIIVFGATTIIQAVAGII